MNAVVGQAFDRHPGTSSALHASALCRRHAARRNPMLHVLPLDIAADSPGKLRGTALEHIEGFTKGFGRGHGASGGANLFATVNAKSVARKSGKLLCMKSLGTQVQDFMTREALTAPALARLVPCSRQNIENLVNDKVRNPKHLPGVARVMRTTVEVLLAGLYVYGPAGVPSAQQAPVDAAPWPLDPFITRERWAQLGEAERVAVAWEASKAVRLMTDNTLPASVPSIERRQNGPMRQISSPFGSSQNPERRKQRATDPYPNPARPVRGGSGSSGGN